MTDDFRSVIVASLRVEGGSDRSTSPAVGLNDHTNDDGESTQPSVPAQLTKVVCAPARLAEVGDLLGRRRIQKRVT